MPLLASSVERILASEASYPSTSLAIEQVSLQIHVYQASEADAFEELAGGDSRGEGEEVMAATVCELPSLGWEGLWESLIYADDIKARLLDYIYATFVFSDADVDCECPCHRVHVSAQSRRQSMSCLGIVLFYCTVLLEQERHPYVARSHKSFPFVFQAG